MRSRRKKTTALILACGLALTPASGGAWAASAGQSGEASAMKADSVGRKYAPIAKSEAEGAEEITDTETGYTYALYQEEEAEGETAVQRARITGYSGTDTKLTIPSKIGQYQVGGIGDGAFKGNAAITSVTIPTGITGIGFEAFQGCESLQSVALPPTITDWSDHAGNDYENNAFAGCTALSQLTLPEGLATLGQNAFQGCVKLESVVIPSTIRTFRDTVFADCTSLAKIELKEGITQMGYHAFQGCTALEEVAIPSTIESWATVHASGIMVQVHDCAPFFGCTSLKTVTFRDGLRNLQGFQGVRGCPLVKELDIPPSVEDIAYAFSGCDQLERVTLHEGIKTIGSEAFKNCAALKEADIPDSVTAIQYSAYRGCIALERLVLPPQAVTLEGSITIGCKNLKELYILAEAVKWYQALDLPSEGKIYCLEGSGTYSTYQAKVPEKVAVIPTAGGGGSWHGMRLRRQFPSCGSINGNSGRRRYPLSSGRWGLAEGHAPDHRTRHLRCGSGGEEADIRAAYAVLQPESTGGHGQKAVCDSSAGSGDRGGKRLRHSCGGIPGKPRARLRLLPGCRLYPPRRIQERIPARVLRPVRHRERIPAWKILRPVRRQAPIREEDRILALIPERRGSPT